MKGLANPLVPRNRDTERKHVSPHCELLVSEAILSYDSLYMSIAASPPLLRATKKC